MTILAPKTKVIKSSANLTFYLLLSDGKILITSGLINKEDQYTTQTEIIDVSNSNSFCRSWAPMPTGIEGAVGAFIGGKAIVCGGEDREKEQNACYQITEISTNYLNRLTETRGYAAGVKVDEDTLWITGGWEEHDHERDSSDYVYSSGQVVPGPRLPKRSWGHQMVKVDDSTYAMIGGAHPRGNYLIM